MNKVIFHLLAIVLFIFIVGSCNSNPEEGMQCIEVINENCVCPRHYDPVCGCNGKIYGNSCEANCAGITEYTEGKCD